MKRYRQCFIEEYANTVRSIFGYTREDVIDVKEVMERCGIEVTFVEDTPKAGKRFAYRVIERDTNGKTTKSELIIYDSQYLLTQEQKNFVVIQGLLYTLQMITDKKEWAVESSEDFSASFLLTEELLHKTLLKHQNEFVIDIKGCVEELKVPKGVILGRGRMLGLVTRD